MPVPEIDDVVTLRTDPALRISGDGAVTAHLTLLYPFVSPDRLDDGLLGSLDAFFGDVVPFRFSLASVARFPGGVVYLVPDPSTPFRHLTHELWRRFPDHPPYGGVFDDVVPHLTVPTGDHESVESVTADLGHRLPVESWAREVHLVEVAPAGVRLLHRFGFATTAA